VTATLDGKVAIVTGAAQGIGAVYARTLAREGAAVVLVDIKQEQAEAQAVQIVEAGGRALALGVDIGDPRAVDAMVRQSAVEFGGIDILVNNGAIYGGYEGFTLEEIPPEYLNRFYDVNATGILVACQAVVPYMRERGGGRIVNQSSTAADLMYNQYGLTKLLVQGLTVGFARALGADNITVNAIAPGPTATPATTDKYPVDSFMTALTIKRMGEPEDLAEFLAFIVSDAADWITGQTFHINGGFWMRPA
jgi:NAD(P)-dependent dehydrogenase (short-subunit alcohol dehydrogenase family)